MKVKVSSSKLGYSYAWQQLRKRVLKEQPICPCGARAVEVDHIIPKRKGGTDDRANLVGLCKRCHSRKSYRERCLMEGKRVRYGADAQGWPKDPGHPWNRKA